ncbi:O-antigen ligase family protein [Flavobacteriaceae bacterium]|nr:O-antigen ligase family protein [Flavobacteriaceae bacterium]
MIYKILLFLYLAITYMPLFGEIDRIGSQSLSMSIVNILSSSFLFYAKNQNDLLEKLKINEIKYFVVFILLILVSFINVINTSEFFIEFFRTVNFFLALVIFMTLSKKISINYIVYLVVFFCLIDVLGLFAQSIQNLPTLGFTANKNIAAFSLAIKLNYVFYLINRYQSILLRFFLFAIYGLGIFSLLSINSKGGILISIISLIYYLFFSLIKLKSNKDLFINTSLIILLTIIINLTGGLGKNTISTIQNSTTSFNLEQGNQDRLSYYSQVLSSFKENPLTGVGHGNWKIASIKFDGYRMRDYIVQYYTHNDFLQVLAEVGLLGLIFYILFFGTIFKKLFLNIFNSIQSNNIFLFLGMAFLTYLADALINFPGSRIVSQLNLIALISLINYNWNNGKD